MFHQANINFQRHLNVAIEIVKAEVIVIETKARYEMPIGNQYFMRIVTEIVSLWRAYIGSLMAKQRAANEQKFST